MKTIYKYGFGGRDILSFDSPFKMKFLTIQKQKDDICVWALVDIDAEVTNEETIYTYVLTLVGTGWHLDNNFNENNYIGTIQDGDFVWHCFYNVTNTVTLKY